MGQWTPDLAVGSSVLLAGVALLLAGVGFLSYRRLRHGRLLWIALAFAGFCAEGVWLALQAYHDRAALAAATGYGALVVPLVNLAIVLCLYVAVLR